MKSNLSQSKQLASLIKDPFHWDLLMTYVAVEKDRLVSQLLQCTTQDLQALQGEMKALSKLEGLKANLSVEEKHRR